MKRSWVYRSRKPTCGRSAVATRICLPEIVLQEQQERRLPPVPSIVSQPLWLRHVPIASRFFLAPLAGYTSLAFRLAVRRCGGLGLATTDLVNARSLIEKRRRALELAETCDEDRPLAIQIYGHVIPEMEQAARWVEANGATVVDINMGCPVRKVVRSGGGSALMCQVDRAVELVEAMVRCGVDPGHGQDAAGLGRRVAHRASTGPRVRADRRGRGHRPRPDAPAGVFRGRSTADGIRAVVEAVDRMPIVANGDVRSIADAATMFAETGCAAISIGRGALANPFFFRQLDHWSRTGEPGPDPRLRGAPRPDEPALPRPGSSAGANSTPASSSARSSSGIITSRACPSRFICA